MSAWWIILLATFLAWFGTRYYTVQALKLQILDVPNQRSSHDAPKPCGAGLVIVVLFAVGSLLLALVGVLHWKSAVALCGAGIAVATAGFLADRDAVSVTARLLIQMFAAVWALAWMGGVGPLQIAGFTLNWLWFGSLIAGVGLVWLVNLYNFMDGIDGLAASEAVFVSVAAAMLESDIRWPALLLAAVCLGFLKLNWSPARVFMGDVGSCFIGMMLGVLALLSSAESSFSPWMWLILLAVFLTDTAVTLARRVVRGDPWYRAHRHHAYQHASRSLGSHGRVVWVTICINAFWLLPLAWLSRLFDSWGLALMILAYAPLIVLAYRMGAGTEDALTVAATISVTPTTNERQ